MEEVTFELGFGHRESHVGLKIHGSSKTSKEVRITGLQEVTPNKTKKEIRAVENRPRMS